MEKMLLAGLEPDKLKQICHVAENMRIRIIVVNRDEYDKTIGELINSKAESAAKAAKATVAFAACTAASDAENKEESMIIFDEVTDKHCDRILFEIRSKKIDVTYKAVTTPVNKIWNIKRMFAQMKQEKLSYMLKNK